MRTGVACAAAVGLVGAALAPATAGGEQDAGSPSASDVAAVGDGSEEVSRHEVTLITGDVVTWQVFADGRTTATVQDAAEEQSFETIESGEDYYVVPADVSPLVGSALDRELFNIPALVEQGYADEAGDGIPVIVLGDRAGMSPAAAHGVTVERQFSSIDGYAGVVSYDQAQAFGDYLADAARAQVTSNDTDPASALAGIDQIRLDRVVAVNLEDSVPQTGAPEAWEAGFDGTGTTIAILDTGIDESHPDIGDKVVAAENFSAADGTNDGHGHGTHVAATAAGTGDASDGLRPGVAPGADLLNGKVLDDAGFGNESGIIAGMEWAADQGADVISMSLGGGATDGTDPMSEAVNTISDEQDVLFVIAAGNSGPSAQSVETPGVADAALTVGAVDKESALASFSGRGPRVGDFAIKPDITAPGVAIVAARATGTTMGTPVDDLYTSANGTSMATPHVAGAAAILAQQHPDWGADALKGALVTTAGPADGLTVYEQGGGELDIASAIDTDVVATPGTLNLGYFQYPHADADPVSETLTYTNHGEDAQTVNLTVNLVDEEGNPAAEGMVTVEPSTVILEPGASADVSVTVDVTVGAESLYSGAVVASTGEDEGISTPTGFFKEGEMFEVTIEGTQRDGRPAGRSSMVDVVDVHDTTAYLESGIGFVDGTATVRVPEGTYSVMSVITTLDEDDAFYLEQTMLGDPELEVAEDIHLVWDAREAAEITVDTGDGAEVQGHSMAYHRAATEVGTYTHSWTGGTWPFSAAETEPATQGAFEFYTLYELGDVTADPVRWYDLVFPHPDAIPADLAYTVGADDLATLDTAYHSDVPDHTYGWTRSKWRPYEMVAFNFLRELTVPAKQVELVTPGDTRWRQQVYAETPFTGSVMESTTTYQAGDQRDISWFASPSTPTLIEGNSDTEGILPVREGDVLAMQIAEWGDAQTGEQQHYGLRDTGVDTSVFGLYQDGELVAEGERAIGEFEVAPGDSRLRIELDVAREAEWWTTSTATSTTWEFDSQSTSEPEPLPLLQVDLDIDVDLRNRAANPRDVRGPATIGLDVRHPRGVDGAEIEGARAWTSHDDGATWIARPVRPTGDGGFEFPVDRRTGDHTSVRVEAWDVDGNTVEQEIIRAYTTREG